MAHLKRRRILYFACMSVAAVFIAAAIAWHRLSLRYHLEPDGFLTHVVQLEAVELDPNSRQALGWSLAVLGRDDEVRTLEFHPRRDRPASSLDPERLELHAVSWREGIEKIAADNRIVLIMEDHCVSKHREFIGAALPVFKNAQFTHYAAEAIGPVDRSLAQRGYPSSLTGLYTSDPRFGNTLRRALDLKFEVLGYDFRPFTHDGREEFAATTLAALFQSSTETKLLVHAGHAHVLKHETEYGERWLAARLWEKSGIEPFTIWQWSSQRDARDHAELVRILEKRGTPLNEPVLLMPPPPTGYGLQDPPYGLARVDAIVLHPPDASVAPGMRTVLFPAEMQKLVGTWTGDLWPVVVSAYKQNEPIDALPGIAEFPTPRTETLSLRGYPFVPPSAPAINDHTRTYPTTRWRGRAYQGSARINCQLYTGHNPSRDGRNLRLDSAICLEVPVKQLAILASVNTNVV